METFWIGQMIDSGRNAARKLLFLESLKDRSVFYSEKSLMGMATVESVDCNDFNVSIALRIKPWFCRFGDKPERISVGGNLEMFSRRLRVLHLSPGYGIDSALVHDPVAIDLVLARIKGGEQPFDLMRLIRDDFRDLPPGVLPEPVVADDISGEPASDPRCRLKYAGNRFFAHFRDLPVDEGRHLAWSTDNPVHILVAICHLFRERAPDLLPHLLERDRQYCQTHPKVVPSIEVSAEKLFAWKPAFAMFYHMRYGDFSLNSGLSNSAAARLLKWIGEYCGFRMEKAVVLPKGPRGSRAWNASGEIRGC